MTNIVSNSSLNFLLPFKNFCVNHFKCFFRSIRLNKYNPFYFLRSDYRCSFAHEDWRFLVSYTKFRKEKILTLTDPPVEYVKVCVKEPPCIILFWTGQRQRLRLRGRERDWEKERLRERQIKRERETDRQIDRKTDRQIERERHKDAHREKTKQLHFILLTQRNWERESENFISFCWLLYLLHWLEAFIYSSSWKNGPSSRFFN